MQEMTHQHTRELNIYYNEHKKLVPIVESSFKMA